MPTALERMEGTLTLLEERMAVDFSEVRAAISSMRSTQRSAATLLADISMKLDAALLATDDEAVVMQVAEVRDELRVLEAELAHDVATYTRPNPVPVEPAPAVEEPTVEPMVEVPVEPAVEPAPATE
jgi:hypothetical protein